MLEFAIDSVAIGASHFAGSCRGVTGAMTSRKQPQQRQRAGTPGRDTPAAGVPSLHPFANVDDVPTYYADAANLYGSGLTISLVFGTRDLTTGDYVARPAEASAIIQMSPQFALGLSQLLSDMVGKFIEPVVSQADSDKTEQEGS